MMNEMCVFLEKILLREREREREREKERERWELLMTDSLLINFIHVLHQRIKGFVFPSPKKVEIFDCVQKGNACTDIIRTFAIASSTVFFFVNKAGYAATPVAFGRVGAVFYFT